jgi:hypothetical protein
VWVLALAGEHRLGDGIHSSMDLRDVRSGILPPPSHTSRLSRNNRTPVRAIFALDSAL